MPEPCLIKVAQINPVESATQIFDEYERFIRRIIHLLNIYNMPEDDLFQDFFLSLISSPVPADVKNVKAYLYRAINNQIFDSSRRLIFYEKKIKKFRKNFSFKDNKNDPTRSLLIEEEMKKMLVLIKESSPGSKYMAITLRFRDGFSAQEVADRMGVKYSSIAGYISRGLGKVRKCLSDT